jgi:hypothetical protein
MKLRTMRSNKYARETYIAGKVYEFDEATGEKMLKLWQQVGSNIVYLFQVEDDAPRAEGEDGEKAAEEGVDSNTSKFSGREGSRIGKTPAPKGKDGDEATDTEGGDEATDPEGGKEETETESPE